VACRCRAKVGHLICSSRSSGRSTCQIKLSGNSSTMVRQLRYHALHCVHKRPVCAIVTANRSKFKRHLATTTPSQCHLQLCDFRWSKNTCKNGDFVFSVGDNNGSRGTTQDTARLEMPPNGSFRRIHNSWLYREGQACETRNGQDSSCSLLTSNNQY